jgi:hypothetical protein
MSDKIPKINIDSLPQAIADWIISKNGDRLLFSHVTWNEKIDYYSRSFDIELMLLKLDDKRIKDETGIILTRETITPYLELYSEGFESGFNELISLLEADMIFSSDEIKARRVMEYIKGWRYGGYPEHCINTSCFITKNLWRQAGNEAGHFYKAWQLIAKNYEPFLKYFTSSKEDEKLSFDSTMSESQIKTLYEGLKGFVIASETTLEQFSAIFTEQITIDKPIKLIASNRLFAYLFDLLYNYNLIENKAWISIIDKGRLLLNNSGKPIKSGDLHTAKSEIAKPGLEPKGYIEINTLMDKLKTP